MPFWLELLISAFIVLGAIFALIGSIGLSKLPDAYTRLHGPTKATTLGVGGMLLAAMAFFTHQQGMLSVHELLITVFLFITAPISAHMLTKVAMHREEPMIERTTGQPWNDQAGSRKRPPRASRPTDRPA